ncbi:MAG TPA: hypothetical protein VK453_08235 [Micromonosporaceae bacterium]|nr:hypothetical protein [Micromonosporaceae bacterium]
MSGPDVDEQYGRDLMRRLASEPDAPSRIDLSAAVAAGRRRRRIRRSSAAAAAVAVTTMMVAAAPTVLNAVHLGPDSDNRPDVASTADAGPTPRPSSADSGPTPRTMATTAPTDCRPTWLPVPSEGSQVASLDAGDPTGTWHAGRHRAADGDSNYLIMIWNDGQLVQRSIELPGANQIMNDINASGTAVGQTHHDGLDRPYAFVGGKTVQLPGVAGGAAAAINEAGTIVGYRRERTDTAPVRWDSAATAAVDLPMPAGYDAGVAVGVDEDGTVVGLIRPPDKQPRPYLWRPDGTGDPLPVPTIGGKSARQFNPTGVRNGWVVGNAVADGAATSQPYRYDIGTRVFERLADDEVIIGAVNGSGWAVGNRHGGGRTEAVYFTGAGSQVLPFTINGLGHGSHGMAVSDDGRTVAGNLQLGAGTRPGLWSCT